MEVKLSELWTEVETALGEKSPSGLRMSIIEAEKVLKAVLDSKGYPGRTIEKQLFWAGYSLKEKDGINEALEKKDQILKDFNYKLTDLEAEETVKMIKKVIGEISKKPALTLKDKVEVIVENYFSPKSVLFWRNTLLFFGFFVIIKLLVYTKLGQAVVGGVVDFTDFVISWAFVIIGLGVALAVFAAKSYLAGKSKVKIKEELS